MSCHLLIRTTAQPRQTVEYGTVDRRSLSLSIDKRPECSKSPMQLSKVDIRRAMHNGPVVSYAHNRFMHIFGMHIPEAVFY